MEILVRCCHIQGVDVMCAMEWSEVTLERWPVLMIVRDLCLAGF